jgi:acyl-CoA synthetase (AMP-forming)/AMP-acid ligase II
MTWSITLDRSKCVSRHQSAMKPDLAENCVRFWMLRASSSLRWKVETANRHSGDCLGSLISRSDEVLAVCRQHLPKYMVPRSVLILDALPLNSNGKIAKPRLREMAAAGGPR